jgi:hypothetical protein
MEEKRTGSVGYSKSSILCPKVSLTVKLKIKVEMNNVIRKYLE